jgi:predicted NBD/HSP70 family sugar kinase
VVRGEHGVSGSIGHIAVPGDTTPCVCGNVGCPDAVAGGRCPPRGARGEQTLRPDMPHSA